MDFEVNNFIKVLFKNNECPIGKWQEISMAGWSSQVHYSKSLPQGEGGNFSPETYDYDLLKSFLAVKDYALEERVKYQSSPHWFTTEKKDWDSYEDQKPVILPVQLKLIEMGYLDPGDDDGIFGPKTEGAIKRYAVNKPNIFEEAWNIVKNFDLNMFK